MLRSMEYRFLGASGLEVSVLSFGTMTLGGEGRFAAMGNVQVEEARRHVEICIDAGVNLFDTADIYSFGKSEEVLGKALGAKRKEVVVATKGFVRLEPGTNKSGLSRRHLIEACEASLRRLGTDYIDLYQAHNFDSITPLDETLRAFDDLTTSGKVRYFGCSNYSGWQLMKAHSISDKLGIRRYLSQQINYSLLARDAEHELVPLGLDQDTGIMAWSPLQFGLLSGKFRRGQERPSESRLNSPEIAAPGTIDEERLYKIVDVLAEIAGQRGVSVSQVAINWVTRKPRVDTVIIGARNEQQLRDNLAAASWSLTDAEVERLDEVSALPLPYPKWHQQKFAGDRNPPPRHVRKTHSSAGNRVNT
ncbi:MAG TPA: aldo/keto reductase [Bryobacteraceae bacterium]|nr:aldo/keto reductase [Bryobacteraceae bacterium]